MTERLLLLIESNTTGTGRRFARRAVAAGAVPVLLTTDPARYPYAAEDRLDTRVVDTSDAGALRAAAGDLARRGRIAGVLSSSEYYVAAAAELARDLGLSGSGAAAVRACRDKAEQRRLLSRAGVPVPGFAAATDRDGALDAARRLGSPVVVKPVQGSGSLGVRLCASAREAADHAETLLRAGANERGIAVRRAVLVESYLPGREFSVEVFDGRAVVTVDKHLGPPPAFVEVGHDLPAHPSTGPEDGPARCAERAVAALGLGFGAVHVELRPDGHGTPRIIEVNPRPAGGMIPELVRHALGVDLIDAQVRAALGERVEMAPAPVAAASIRFLTAESDGVMASARAIREARARARAIAGVVDAALYREPGAPVAPAVDFRGRLGHVIAVSDGPETAARAARTALRELAAAMTPGAVSTPGATRTEVPV